MSLTRVASIEDCEGRKVTIDAGRRVVSVVIPATEKSPEIELSFGPALTRRFAEAMAIAADISEVDK